jgi:hypothetical protein
MSQKLKISAKQILADIKTGATNEFLMKKYGVSPKGLQSIFDKLIAAGVATTEIINFRGYEETAIKTDGTIVIAQLTREEQSASEQVNQQDTSVTPPRSTKQIKNTSVAENQDQEAIAEIVTLFKSLLAEGKEKMVLRKFLTKNLWDKNEARQFVDQIAKETWTNPDDILPLIKRYKKYMFWGGLATLLGTFLLLFGSGEVDVPAKFALFGSIALIWGFLGWLVYSRRLKSCHLVVNEAVNFRPTKGNLILQPVSALGYAGLLVVGLLGIIAVFILGLLIINLGLSIGILH